MKYKFNCYDYLKVYGKNNNSFLILITQRGFLLHYSCLLYKKIKDLNFRFKMTLIYFFINIRKLYYKIYFLIMFVFNISSKWIYMLIKISNQKRFFILYIRFLVIKSHNGCRKIKSKRIHRKFRLNVF